MKNDNELVEFVSAKMTEMISVLAPADQPLAASMLLSGAAWALSGVERGRAADELAKRAMEAGDRYREMRAKKNGLETDISKTLKSKVPGRAKGGLKRAENLSAERRKEIAKRAAHTRWSAPYSETENNCGQDEGA